MVFITQKRTGEGSSTSKDMEEFDRYCHENEYEMMQFNVTDEEHELLSLDSKTPFLISKNGKVYNTVMEAYNDIIEDDDKMNLNYIYAQMFVLISDKFDQNEEARNVLMSTRGYIIYKTENDNCWGSRVPEFDGLNIAGEIMVELRDFYY